MSDAPGPKEAASFTLTRKTVTVHDLPVDVYRAGSGPTLVWFHGIHGVREDDAVLRMLAATHDVVAPVAPGFNDLEDLKQVRTVHDLAWTYALWRLNGVP